MRILLVITGGIAAYKSLELIRLMRESSHEVTVVMSRAAEEFVTPLSVEAIAGTPVYSQLFQPGQESDIGHIRLAREHDLIVVAPASADFLAKMNLGLADDLASTIMLATQTPILVAPAMNPMMWSAISTQSHVKHLEEIRDVIFIGPDSGDMACGESGVGRMAEPVVITYAVEAMLSEFAGDKPLLGKHFVVTGGPTFEAIDPVRYIGNHSSGRQAVSIVEQLLRAGAAVQFIHGPIAEPIPFGCEATAVVSAEEMLDAAKQYRETDGFIAAAAVADWTVDKSPQKIKKSSKTQKMTLSLKPNPDILAEIGNGLPRPPLVVGFAAETEPDTQKACALGMEKCERKGCDFLLLNQISAQNPAFDQDHNHLYCIARDSDQFGMYEDWGRQPKIALAQKLVDKIIAWNAEK